MHTIVGGSIVVSAYGYDLLAISIYALHSPSLLILSAPLTLKEYTTPICSGSTIYCDVVLVMLMVLVAVTST